MSLRHNRKAIAFQRLIKIILIIVGAAVIIMIIPSTVDKAEISTAQTICRTSVLMREESSEATLKIAKSPLLCKTIDDIKIPSKKDDSKEDVMRTFAHEMVNCWWQFGDGLIDDVFKEGDLTTKNCMMCYITSTTKTSKFKEEISTDEFLKYLINTPYKIEVEGDRCKSLGGFCEKSKETCAARDEEGKKYWKSDENNIVCKSKYNQKDEEKPVCCHSSYSCLNSGGKCVGNKEKPKGYEKYDKWECSGDEKCYIKEENYVTYARYIQSYNGQGNIIITTPIEPNQAYAVSFGSPNGGCGVCQLIGAGLGLYFGPVGAGVAYVATGLAVEEFVELFTRDKNTIYLTTLDDALAEKRCNRITDVKGN